MFIIQHNTLNTAITVAREMRFYEERQNMKIKTRDHIVEFLHSPVLSLTRRRVVISELSNTSEKVFGMRTNYHVLQT